MGAVREGLEEMLHVLAEQRVIGHLGFEIRQLLPRGKRTVDQQVGDFEKRRLLGELLDRVTPMAQDSLIAVDVGHRTLAFRGIAEAAIECEESGLSREMTYVEPGFGLRAGDDRQA